MARTRRLFYNTSHHCQGQGGVSSGEKRVPPGQVVWWGEWGVSV